MDNGDRRCPFSFMRLDLFLKSSRLVLRRSIARQLCDAGRISVNGSKAKASKETKAGDEIELRRGSRKTVVRVIEIPRTKQVSKAAADSLIEILAEETEADTLLTRGSP
jgi:ribosomal 50S subunit-recycling heat shock protein